jgi:hypothetical protein
VGRKVRRRRRDRGERKKDSPVAGCEVELLAVFGLAAIVESLVRNTDCEGDREGGTHQEVACPALLPVQVATPGAQRLQATLAVEE